MQRQFVSSSNLRSVGYDVANGILEIEFNSGGTYQYFNVPMGEYQGLMNAPSLGTYFHVNIKGRYRYSQVR